MLNLKLFVFILDAILLWCKLLIAVLFKSTGFVCFLGWVFLGWGGYFFFFKAQIHIKPTHSLKIILNKIIYLINKKKKKRKKINIVYTYFRGYIHLRFKHAALDTHLSCLDCLGK